MKRYTAIITCICLIVVSGCAGFATAPPTRVDATNWPGGESHRSERAGICDELPGPEIYSAPATPGDTLALEQRPTLALGLGLLPPADVPPLIEENSPRISKELAYAIVGAIAMGIAWYRIAHDDFDINWSHSD